MMRFAEPFPYEEALAKAERVTKNPKLLARTLIDTSAVTADFRDQCKYPLI